MEPTHPELGTLLPNSFWRRLYSLRNSARFIPATDTAEPPLGSIAERNSMPRVSGRWTLLDFTIATALGWRVMADKLDRREHERITIQMKTRLWLDETVAGRARLFEGFAETEDLAIGGTFIVSPFLLSTGTQVNLQMWIDDTETLSARGEIVHQVGHDASRSSGMGIMFTEVDAENRERLLRFFVSDRIKDFYNNRFVVEFPH